MLADSSPSDRLPPPALPLFHELTPTGAARLAFGVFETLGRVTELRMEMQAGGQPGGNFRRLGHLAVLSVNRPKQRNHRAHDLESGAYILSLVTIEPRKNHVRLVAGEADSLVHPNDGLDSARRPAPALQMGAVDGASVHRKAIAQVAKFGWARAAERCADRTGTSG